jgi:methyltransferase (TIGR00027 family)
VAAIRAAAVLESDLRGLFDDPIALSLMPPRARLVLRLPPLRRLWLHRTERLQRGYVHDVLVRARYAHERLAARCAGGVRQALILGAGLDATAWLPGLPDDLAVFEVDHPGSQERKRAVIAEMRRAPNFRTAYVPADFAAPREPGWLGRALAPAGFRRDLPAVVTALGVLSYLDGARVRELLQEAARACAPGSELIVTWFSRVVLDPAARSREAARVARRVERAGEPFLSAHDPDEMADLMRSTGWRLDEHLDGHAMTRRYLQGLGKDRVVAGGVNLARANWA